MLLRPKILLYIITVAVLIAAVVWEIYVQNWIAQQPANRETLVRVDLFVIWPVVLTLVGVSLFRLFGKKR